MKISSERWKILNTYIKMQVLSSVNTSAHLAKLLSGDATILHKILKTLADKSTTSYAALSNFYNLAFADTTRYLMTLIFRSFTERIFEFQLQRSLSKQLYHDLLDPISWAFLKALILEHSVSSAERKNLNFNFHFYSFPNFARFLVKPNKDFLIALLLMVIVNYLQRLVTSPETLIEMKNNIFDI